jgi:hypothetical protein
MVHFVKKGIKGKMKRGIHKKKTGKELVTISVAENWKKIDREAIKLGFKNKRRGKFFETTTYIEPENWEEVSKKLDVDYVPDINIQVNGNVYDKAVKEILLWNNMKEVDLKKMDEERYGEFNDSVNNLISSWIKDGQVENKDIIEVYAFANVMKDLKVAYPNIRTMTHWNSAFNWIHVDDFLDIMSGDILDIGE